MIWLKYLNTQSMDLLETLHKKQPDKKKTSKQNDGFFLFCFSHSLSIQLFFTNLKLQQVKILCIFEYLLPHDFKIYEIGNLRCFLGSQFLINTRLCVFSLIPAAERLRLEELISCNVVVKACDG